jgi:hypothetical protein
MHPAAQSTRIGASIAVFLGPILHKAVGSPIWRSSAAPSWSLKDRADEAQQLFIFADISYCSSTSLLSCAFPLNISPGCRGQRCEPAVNGLKSHILYLYPSFALVVTACTIALPNDPVDLLSHYTSKSVIGRMTTDAQRQAFTELQGDVYTTTCGRHIPGFRESYKVGRRRFECELNRVRAAGRRHLDGFRYTTGVSGASLSNPYKEQAK